MANLQQITTKDDYQTALEVHRLLSTTTGNWADLLAHTVMDYLDDYERDHNIVWEQSDD